RGLYSLDGECSNTCMEVDGIPNVRCENTLLKDGMVIKEQNVKGSAEHDMMSFLDKMDWLMPAGFYYNVMHKPARIWPIAMKQIRKVAGLGKISPDYKMPGKFDEVFLNTDVCVIGGGPSGMMAALSAAKKGLRVIIMESRPWLGGFFEYRSKEYKNSKTLHDRAKQLANEVTAQENIRVFTHTSAVGTYNNNLVTGFQIGKKEDVFNERYIEIRAKSVVAAAGCIERPLIFDNNERSGVMQIGCALRMAKTYGQLPGKKTVFSIGHDLGLEAALELHDLGLAIVCIADIREDGQDPQLLEKIQAKKIPLFKGWVAKKALGAKRVKGVDLSSVDGQISKTFACDLIVASAGMTPVTGHITVALGTLKYDTYTGFFLPDRMPDKMHAAGRILGLNDHLSIEASGVLAGLKAAFDCESGSIKELGDAQEALENLPGPVRGTKLVTAPVKGRKSFICFDEDATIKNIKQAIEKGFDVPELIKRFTATGLGPGQGGIPGHNLPLYVAKYQALPDISIRPTNVRPPLVPTLLATYAGVNHKMFKITPMDEMQKKDGGIFRNIGVWQRARYFSDDLLCKKEIENVRNNVGILDGSTLGKFRIHGPDAL
ncbi:MAG: FAD-dependent oxidoreductase, partial [Desulfobacula sp.]|nr:FAD-dependent oxidoreductase [Desulfobacula sp.]